MGPVLSVIVLISIYLFFTQEKQKRNYYWWLPLPLFLLPFLFIPKKNTWYVIVPCVYLIIMAAGAFSEWGCRQKSITRLVSSTIVLALLMAQFLFFTFIHPPSAPAAVMPFPYTNTALCNKTAFKIVPESMTYRSKIMLANIEKPNNDAGARHLLTFTAGEIHPIIDFILSGEAPNIIQCGPDEWEKIDVIFWLVNKDRQTIAAFINQGNREKFNQAIIRDWTSFVEYYRELIDVPDNSEEIQSRFANARVQALPTGDFLLYP